MTKFSPIALLAAVASLALIPSAVSAAETNQQVRETANAVAAPSTVTVTTGKMLYGPNGARIASVYRVTSNGDAQIILNSRLFTVPASTLTETNGKISTSLSKTEINRR